MLGSDQSDKTLGMRFLSTLFILCGIVLAPLSVAEPVSAEREKTAIVEALETALSKLPDEKQASAQSVVDQFRAAEMYSDYTYGWERAESILVKGGVTRLIREADTPRGSLRYAKVDALLAAGVHLRDAEPDDAARLNAALLSMAKRADDFEQPVYGHAAAELAAVRCDKGSFEAAMSLLPNPESMRYRFWSARIDGEAEPVIANIQSYEEFEDTRMIRQAIDGYRLIHDFGYCGA